MGTRRVELVLLVVMFLAGLALRLPNLMWIPRYTDEGREVMWALDIAEGLRQPLTGVDEYTGPFFPYFVAGLFKVFGAELEIPRLLAAGVGALTIVAAYGLARALGGRAAGWVAAALVAVNPTLLVNSSHYGIASAFPPLLVTLTALLLYVGVMRKRGGLVLLSGITAALALQTHPTTAVALVGLALWFLWQPQGRDLLRSPAPYLALALFLLVYAPMLIVNLRPDSPMFSAANDRPAFEMAASPLAYMQALAFLGWSLMYVLGGGLIPNSVFTWVMVGLANLVVVLALLRQVQRGQLLIPFVFLSTLLLLPLWVREASYRYFIYLAPLGLVAVGTLTSEVLNWGTCGASNFIPGVGVDLDVRVLALARDSMGRAYLLLIVLMVVFALVTVTRHYEYASRTGLSNAEFFRLRDVVRGEQACGERLLIEDNGHNPAIPFNIPTRIALNAVEYVLRFDRCTYQTRPRTEIVRQLTESAVTSGPRGWVITAERDAPTIPLLEAHPVTIIAAPPLTETVIPITLYEYGGQ